MKSIKLMVLGIALIVVSIYIQGEPGIKFYGNEVFIAIIGFVLICVGFFMNDQSEDEDSENNF